jgi:hypothetical protein
MQPLNQVLPRNLSVEVDAVLVRCGWILGGMARAFKHAEKAALALARQSSGTS